MTEAEKLWHDLKRAASRSEAEATKLLDFAIGEEREAGRREGYERGIADAAQTALHLNGWGNVPNPELATHISKNIRALIQPKEQSE